MSKNLLLRFIPGFSILAAAGTLIGFAVDRVSGRAISNFQFFKQGLMPDGIHYEIRTLRFLGNIDTEILSNIRAQYQHTGLNVTNYFLHPDSWEAALVEPRLLFSLISVVFVKFLGLTGFFVVPMACFVLLSLAPMYFNTRYLDGNQKLLSFGLSLVLMGSFYAKFNILANTTDGLSAFLVVTLVLLLVKNYSHNESKSDFYLIPFVCLLACMTRQNEIYVVGLMLIFSLNKFRKNKKTAIFIAVYSAILLSSWFIFSFIKYKNYAIITDSSGQSLGGNGFLADILELILSIPQTVFIEFFQLLIRDTGVFILLIFSLLMIFPLRKISLTQQLFLWVLFSGIFLTCVNGSLGSGFRYAIPAIYISAFTILEFWNRKNV